MKLRLLSLAAMSLVALACDLAPTETGTAADVVGRWSYSGTQLSPGLELEGEIVVSSQEGSSITGTLTYREVTPMSESALFGAPLGGRVVGSTDADFDVYLPDGDRRHVARLIVDTMEGQWIEAASGRRGTFRAVRSR